MDFTHQFRKIEGQEITDCSDWKIRNKKCAHSSVDIVCFDPWKTLWGKQTKAKCPRKWWANEATSVWLFIHCQAAVNWWLYAEGWRKLQIWSACITRQSADKGRIETQGKSYVTFLHTKLYYHSHGGGDNRELNVNWFSTVENGFRWNCIPGCCVGWSWCYF